MTRYIQILACCGVVFLGLVGGCPPPDDENGSNADNGTTDNNGTGQQCGQRSVTQAPSGGYLRYIVATELVVDPLDSALAKVAFGAAPCSATGEPVVEPAPLYHIDAAGNVVEIIQLLEGAGDYFYFSVPVTGQRIRLKDRCLVLEGTDGEEDSGAADQLDPLNPHVGPCGSGYFAITKQGMTDEVEGPYICVSVHAVSACRDCWYEDGIWYEKIVTTGYYVAEGSLSGVSIDEWAAVCDPDSVGKTVNIQQGDRVDFTWTTITEYQPSASPEQMGYQELPTP